MLTWRPRPADPEVFHITHVGNLSSIIRGGLYCDAKIAAGVAQPTTIGSASIKNRRLTWTLDLPDRPCVGSFVPFYFCPRSEMLYRVHRGHSSWSGGQDDVVHLVTRVAVLASLGKRVVFTDVNAATAYHYASENLAEIATRIDWSVMPLLQWSGAASSPRQAELLVDDLVPWGVFERIVVRDRGVENRVHTALGGARTPLVQVDPSWYY